MCSVSWRASPLNGHWKPSPSCPDLRLMVQVDVEGLVFGGSVRFACRVWLAAPPSMAALCDTLLYAATITPFGVCAFMRIIVPNTASALAIMCALVTLGSLSCWDVSGLTVGAACCAGARLAGFRAALSAAFFALSAYMIPALLSTGSTVEAFLDSGKGPQGHKAP